MKVLQRIEIGTPLATYTIHALSVVFHGERAVITSEDGKIASFRWDCIKSVSLDSVSL